MKKALDFIIEWAENTSWKNHLINTVLMEEESSVTTLADEIAEIVNTKKTVPLRLCESASDGNLRLRIDRISNPQNINALYNESDFFLGHNLNVFYGENGSGKSSYVRVFRKLANHYITEAKEKELSILPNVHTISGNADQKIYVSYTCNDETTEELIDIDQSHPLLCNINVFDMDSIVPLIENNLSFSVLPRDLMYFNDLTMMLDQLKAEFAKRANQKEIEQTSLFSDSQYKHISEEITNINSKVAAFKDIKTFLDLNYPISSNIEEDIANITGQIRQAENLNPVAVIKNLSLQKDKLTELKTSITGMSTKIETTKIKEINHLLDSYKKTIQEEKQLSSELSRRVSFLKVFNKEWLEFIRASKRYYGSANGQPAEGDQCIYCGKPMGAESISLIQVYNNYLNSDAVIQRQAMEKQISGLSIANLVCSLDENYEKLFDKAELILKLKAVVQQVNNSKEIFERSLTAKQQMDISIALNVNELTQDIITEIKDIDTQLDLLNKTSSEANEYIVKLKQQKEELEKWHKLHQSLSVFEEWYLLKDAIKKLHNFEKSFSTTTLSKKSKEAFAYVIQESYQEMFYNYLSELQIESVGIKFSSQKGQTLRKKLIEDHYSITQIMSEGEQKAIAMAEFLTDLNIRGNYNTVLFDDPVNSLDYKRSEKIADLIYQLSLDHQVLVFTHNIMFYYALCRACEKPKNPENKFFKVDAYDRDNKGIVTASTNPRFENLRGITGKIKDQKQTIDTPKCTGDVLEESLKKVYSDIRTWCELIVEEGFFNKVIRRYEPNIMFTKVKEINGDFLEHIPSVVDLFDRSCRWMSGHSQPGETQNTRASLDAFRVDYEFITKLYDKYKS